MRQSLDRPSLIAKLREWEQAALSREAQPPMLTVVTAMRHPDDDFQIHRLFTPPVKANVTKQEQDVNRRRIAFNQALERAAEQRAMTSSDLVMAVDHARAEDDERWYLHQMRLRDDDLDAELAGLMDDENDDGNLGLAPTR